jgi:hypothetical protein
METKTQSMIRLYMEEKNYKIISQITNQSEKITYICKCNVEKIQTFKDLKRGKKCRTCTTLEYNKIPSDENEIDENKDENKDEIDENTGEIWKCITGGKISNFGNCKNIEGRLRTLCPTKSRYTINGVNHYASRLVAITFKIMDYEKLDSQLYVVRHIDGNKFNNTINNLEVVSKTVINSANGKNSRKSYNFKHKFDLSLEDDFTDIEKIIIDFLPNHIFLKNGEIYNGNRFLTGSLTPEGYLSLNLTKKTYKIHRLICYAFNKIEGKNTFEDYSDLQVNHKDGNKVNNNADNLEWNTQSENITHAYATNCNKKKRSVIQYDAETNDVIQEFTSIADASRKTVDKEHMIRESAKKDEKYSTAVYMWRFKKPEDTILFSKKYSKQ